MTIAASPDIDVHRELVELAHDLRWGWHRGATELFSRLDPEAFEATGRDPLRVLRLLGPMRLARALAEPETARLAAEVLADFAAYRDRADTWFPTTHPDRDDLVVACFSAEYALADALPIFAGGLGAVAGEIVKSASALDVPVVGVGLLYRESSHQWLDEDGRQQEAWESLQPRRLPLRRARDLAGEDLTVSIDVASGRVHAAVWEAQVGRRRVLLLDTAVRENDAVGRAVGQRLYGGDQETRISQELLLGVGGHRALVAAGWEPDVVHLNEGHSAFVTLERIARARAVHGLDLDEARILTAASTVFTTHTPVAAGHDYFPVEMAERHLAPLAEPCGLALEDLIALGQVEQYDRSAAFCPTVLALRLADAANAVSRLHGAVTRQQWSVLWPRVPVEEVPITHVTNGVHLQTWISDELDEVFHTELGARWRTTPGDAAMWETLHAVGDDALWTAHSRARARLVDHARSVLVRQLERRGADAEALRHAGCRLDPEALTIGFVGRFVAYKRPTLFLRDEARLQRLLGDDERPVQIVFAGKAHPRDEVGKELLASVVDFARRAGLSHRIVFLEDFDMAMDKALVQGVDVWLNTPRRPLEACGIAGMKAGANGALNLSTLDGWWDEAIADARPGRPGIGWVIGDDREDLTPAEQDEVDAASLYERLETEVVECFYDRDAHGLPLRWLASMRESMGTLAPMWSSHRMVRDYCERLYVPAAERAAGLAADGARLARDLAAAEARARRAWDEVRVQVRSVRRAGADLRVVLDVDLGDLAPEDVEVDAWVHPPGGEPRAVVAAAAPTREAPGRWVASIAHPPRTRHPHVSARVRFRHPASAHAVTPHLIRWSA